MPTYLVLKKDTLCTGITIFNSIPPSVTFLKNGKEKFRAAIRKYLNTHSFYSVDELFKRKGDLQ
jgi:hypothetical protein